MLMRLHGHEDLQANAQTFLRYCAVVPLTTELPHWRHEVNDANRFSENRRRQGDLGRTRKQQQPLASFQNEVQPSTRIFMMRYRVRARRLFWSARKRAVKRRDP